MLGIFFFLIWFHGVGKSLASRKTSYAKLQKVSYSAFSLFCLLYRNQNTTRWASPWQGGTSAQPARFCKRKANAQSRIGGFHRGAAAIAALRPPTFCHGVSLRRVNCVRGNRRCTRALINTLDHTGVGGGGAGEGVATANNNRRGILSFLASATLNFRFRLILGLPTISKMWVCWGCDDALSSILGSKDET